LKSSSADIYALIERIENADAKADAEAYARSKADEVARAYAQGRAAGRAEAKSTAAASSDDGVGRGVNGYSWAKIAQFLQANADQLSGFEHQFCSGIDSQMRYRPPSPKQAAIIHRIFVDRFGGEIT
jgi:hypothetical protein